MDTSLYNIDSYCFNMRTAFAKDGLSFFFLAIYLKLEGITSKSLNPGLGVSLLKSFPDTKLVGNVVSSLRCPWGERGHPDRRIGG